VASPSNEMWAQLPPVRTHSTNPGTLASRRRKGVPFLEPSRYVPLAVIEFVLAVGVLMVDGGGGVELPELLRGVRERIDAANGDRRRQLWEAQRQARAPSCRRAQIATRRTLRFSQRRENVWTR
jgi:hypothetical protein